MLDRTKFSSAICCGQKLVESSRNIYEEAAALIAAFEEKATAAVLEIEGS